MIFKKKEETRIDKLFKELSKIINKKKHFIHHKPTRSNGGRSARYIFITAKPLLFLFHINNFFQFFYIQILSDFHIGILYCKFVSE